MTTTDFKAGTPVTVTPPSAPSENHKTALIVVSVLFFLCGFTAVLNYVLIPYVRTVLHLRYTQVVLIQTSFYLAYFTVSPTAGFIFRHRGHLPAIRWGLALGCLGCLLFSLASTTLWYPLVLVAIFIIGSGIAVIQVSANPYAVLLGPASSAASRLSFSQACTSTGSFLAPFLGSLVILSSVATFSNTQTPHWPLQKTYLLLAFIWLGLLALTTVLRLPQGRTSEDASPSGEGKGIFHPLTVPSVVVGVFGIVLAVGTEATVGSFLVSFIADPDVAGVPLATAGKASMIFWLGFLVGRLAGSLALRKIDAARLLWYHASAGAVLAAVATVASGRVAIVAVLGLGLCTSVMFPVVFSLALERWRGNTSQVSGFLCMGNIGGAVVPLMQGALADNIGIHHSFIVPAVCYLSLMGYAYHQQRRTIATPATKDFPYMFTGMH